MSANSPIFKGKLAAIDSRFFVLEKAMDDRTEEEKDSSSSKFIYKSRYASIYSYLSETAMIKEYHNDYPKMEVDKEFLDRLVNETHIKGQVAEHIANLFVRDPLVLFDKHLDPLDEYDSAQFECFQSTNWNSLRFKFPTLKEKKSCFKIEVRPMDMMLTPLENAAIVTFTLLIVEAFYKYTFTFIIPISKVDENFKKAVKIDAISKEKFTWNTAGICPKNKTCCMWSDCKHEFKRRNTIEEFYANYSLEDDQASWKELSIDAIMNGSSEYSGLIPLLREYVSQYVADGEQKDTYNRHLDFLSWRAAGKLVTGAKYVRDFVLNHPDYNGDSVVTEVKP